MKVSDLDSRVDNPTANNLPIDEKKSERQKDLPKKKLTRRYKLSSKRADIFYGSFCQIGHDLCLDRQGMIFKSAKKRRYSEKLDF